MYKLEYPRHNFAWIDRDLSESDFKTCSGKDKHLLIKWAKQCRPFIVPRPKPDLQSSDIDLGLATPPSQGKRRINLRISRNRVIRYTPPPKLSDIWPTASTKWHPILRKLVDEAKYIGIDFRVYGAFAWEYLTKIPYVTTTSDIDLVWQPNDSEQLRKTIKLLKIIERNTTCRLDGEVLYRDGIAVAWKELDQGCRQVLAKSISGSLLYQISNLSYASSNVVD